MYINIFFMYSLTQQMFIWVLTNSTMDYREKNSVSALEEPGLLWQSVITMLVINI